MESSPQTAPPLLTLEALLRDASSPLPAKSLQSTLGLKTKEWKALLVEAAARGIAKLWPKGRYWHLSPDEATLSWLPALVAELRNAAAPLTEAELATRMAMAAGDLKPVLKAALATLQVSKWPGNRYWHLSPNEAITAGIPAVIKELEHSATPLTEAELASRLSLAPAELKPVLKASLASRQVHKWPEDRYWHLSPDEATAAQIPAVIKELEHSATPLTEAELAARLTLAPAGVKTILKTATAAKQLHKWPQNRYWHLSPTLAATARVPAMVEELERAPAPLTEADLATRLGADPAQLKTLVKAALATGRIVKWPNSRYWHSAEAAAVRNHLLAALQSGTLPANRLEQATPPYSTPNTVAKVLKDMLASGAVVLAYALPPADLTQQLLDAIQQLQRAPGIPVPVRDLRAAVAAPKADFDRAALALADRQRIYLTTHDHGWALPAAEQDILIHDGGTKLYVAVTLRD